MNFMKKMIFSVNINQVSNLQILVNISYFQLYMTFMPFLIVIHRYRGQNNAWSSDMSKQIYHLMGHKFSQFQALPDYFVNKKNENYLVSFQAPRYIIYQQSKNKKPKNVYLPCNITNNNVCCLFSVCNPSQMT